MGKYLRKTLVIVLITVISTVLMPRTSVQAAKIRTVKTQKVTVKKGKKKTLKAKKLKGKIKWKSSNKKIVTVTKKGRIKARKAGKAKVTATAGRKRQVFRITVTVPKAKNKNNNSDNTVKKQSVSSIPDTVTGGSSKTAAGTGSSKASVKSADTTAVHKKEEEKGHKESEKAAEAEADNKVVIDGICFDLKGFDNEYASGHISTDKDMSLSEIRIVINNNVNVYDGDNTPFNMAGGGSLYGDEHGVYVPEVKNHIAHVRYGFDRRWIEINSWEGYRSGSFPVEVYYKDQLVCRKTFKIKSTYKDTDADFDRLVSKIVDEAESHISPGTDLYTAINTAVIYAMNNYKYSQLDCHGGAHVLARLYLNRGYMVRFNYPYVDPVKGLYDYGVSSHKAVGHMIVDYFDGGEWKYGGSLQGNKPE